MKTTSFICFFIVLSFLSCEYEKFPAPKIPRTPNLTNQLNALYFQESEITMNSSEWGEVDYMIVNLSEISSQNQYSEDGILNANGTYNGFADFNRGDSAGLTLRAIYNDEYVYILAEWTDNSLNSSFMTKFWGGKPDVRADIDTAGWTAQKNSDNLYLHFTQTNGSILQDIWQWNMAVSEPLGYAIDQNIGADGISIYDEGEVMFELNANSYREAPLYEWNGEAQLITKGNNSTATLDPAYFLVNTIPFSGDASLGHAVYKHSCQDCHGYNGTGEGPGAYAKRLNSDKYLRYSRQGLTDVISADIHDGSSYFGKLNEAEKENLLAYLRGISGVPGAILKSPSGSIADVTTESAINVFKIQPNDNSRYKVMLKRKLQTLSADDVQFDPINNTVYSFGVFLSDNDDLNKIGAENQILEFIKEDN